MNYIKNFKDLLLFSGLLCCTFFINAQEDLLLQEVSIAFEDITLKESLKELETETGINTAFNEAELNDKKITLTFEKELLSEVLEAILENENLEYKLVGNTVSIFRAKKVKKKPSRKAVKKAKKKEVEENFTLSGYILDASSKETLIGASVYLPELNQGTTSNEYGFYSLTLPKAEYEMHFSYLGYKQEETMINLDSDQTYSSELILENQLSEVVITDDATTLRHSETKMSVHKLSLDKLEAIPVLMGERDLIKMIQLMPGIQSGSEGSTGLYVRGGGPDQNLILIDGVPIYNVNHLFGFLSTLNGEAIKNAEIYKGGFPARFGGRLSSIMDIRMKEGNMEEMHGSISMGLISGRFNLEGPIKKNKTSFHISGRRTWLDAITGPAQRASNATERNNYFFYDLNAKVNHKFSEKSRLFFGTYLGKDYLKYRYRLNSEKEDGDLMWGNWISSLRWNYRVTPKLFANTTVYNSFYDFEFSDIISRSPDSEIGYIDTYNSKSKIRDYGAKVDLNYLPSPGHHIRFGLGAIQHNFTPTVNFQSFQEGSEPPVTITQAAKETKAIEASAYIENDMAITSKIRLNAGVHFSHFNVNNINYSSVQPRAALSYGLNDISSVKLSYSNMTQFLHLLASPGLGLPTDLWVPSTDIVKPEHSVQYALGYTRSLSQSLELTVEGYYKTLGNVLEYKSGFNIFTGSDNWEEKVLVGDGHSYGAEVMLEKRIGKTTGWIGYTWSRSFRNFPDIAQGKTFPYKYDRRHDISIAATHKLNDRIDFGLIWVYGTGNTYTLGANNYNALGAGAEPLYATGLISQLQTINHVPNRNNQRAPAYHRLDLSVNFHKLKKRGKRTWSFGFYNAYSRQNPFTVTLAERPDNNELYLKQTSLIPIIPFATYLFKF